MGAISQSIFWEDKSQRLSYADVLRRAAALKDLFKNLPKGAICSLEGFSPLETWVLILSAWSCRVSVLPFAQRATRDAIEIALAQVPWSIRLSPRLSLEGQTQGIQRESNPEGLLGTKSHIFIMSSGSTGAPKAIGHTRGSLAASARATLQFYNWTQGDSWLLSLDPSHIGGLQILMRVWLGRGLCYYGGEPKDVADALKIRAFAFLSLVPTQLFRLLESSGVANHLREAKAILLGGAATQESLLQRLKTLDLPVSITYGASEAASQISAFRPHHYPEGQGDVGRLLPIWRMEARKNGDLWLAGPALMQGYWLGKAWNGCEDGRLLLSDRGSLEGRQLRIEGRRDEVFQVGGENLAPGEILSLIEDLYPLSDLVVLARPDAEFGSIPELILRSRSKPDADFLQKRLASLPPIKRPRAIFWFESDEVSKLSKAYLEHLRQSGHSRLHRLWTYEKI